MKVPNRENKLWWGIILSTILLSACLETKDSGSILGNNKYRGVNTNDGTQATVENTPQHAEESTLGALSHNATPPTPQGEGKRVALVVGNSTYNNSVGPLEKPTNDAQDLAGALGKLGFEVILKKNLDKPQMEEVLRNFAQQLRGAKLGMFFYAGHGIQHQGENYLVPVSANAEVAEAELRGELVTADQILVAMEQAGTPTKVIILDACRNNPVFTSGLASVEPKASYGGGTFIAYSTQPKNVAQDGSGRNSPYTESLLQFIDQPNLPIEMLFKKIRSAVAEKTAGKQIPWENNALLGGDLCLAGCFSASGGDSGGGSESSSGYCTTKVGQGLYQGQCQNGLPHGQGVMKYQSGEYYKGSFSNGLRHGPGVQYLPDGMEMAGNFCNGRLCN